MPTIDTILDYAQRDPQLLAELRRRLDSDHRMRGLSANSERARTIANEIANETFNDYAASKSAPSGTNAVLSSAIRDINKPSLSEESYQGAQRSVESDLVEGPTRRYGRRAWERVGHGDSRGRQLEKKVGFLDVWKEGYGWRESPEGLIIGALSGEGLPEHWSDGTQFTFWGNLAREIQSFLVPSTFVSFGVGGKVATKAVGAVGKRAAVKSLGKKGVTAAAKRGVFRETAKGKALAKSVAWSGDRAARKAQRDIAARKGIRKAIEDELLRGGTFKRRLGAQAAVSAGALGAHGAVGEAALQFAAGEFDPQALAAATMRSAATGAIALGPIGATVLPKALAKKVAQGAVLSGREAALVKGLPYAKYVAESLAFGTVAPAMEGHTPTKEDVLSSFAFLGVLKSGRLLSTPVRNALAKHRLNRTIKEQKLVDKAEEAGQIQPVRDEISLLYQAEKPVEEGVVPRVEEVKRTSVKGRKDFTAAFKEHFALEEKDAQLLGVVSDARAQIWADQTGARATDWYRKIDVGQGKMEGVAGVKGATEILSDGRRVVWALERPDISTAIHELGHVFTKDLQDAARVHEGARTDLDALQKFAGVTDTWNRAAHEKVARAFERYMRDGEAPTPELAGAFETFKGWLRKIYRNVKQSPLGLKMTDPVRDVFDRMLTEKAIPREARVHEMELAREEREMAKVKLTPEEEGRVTKAAKQAKADPTKVLDAVRRVKARFSEKKGWAGPLVFDGIKPDGSPKFKTQRYTYHLDPKTGKPTKATHQARVTTVADRMVTEVEDIARKAKAGDANAKVMVRQLGWYRNLRDRLREDFGGSADLFADLLAAFSPQTGTRQNWNFAISALREMSLGRHDAELAKFHRYLEKGGSVREFQGKKIRQLNGKLFGTNSTSGMLAMLDMWRIIRPGMAPKGRVFGLNIIGRTPEATIDVWAARTLQRLARQKRIPLAAEGPVRGEYLQGAKRVGGQFGFGQDVFREAAAKLNKKGTLGKIDPRDLQALVWFAEKELWGRKRWTSTLGEGGSFEKPLAESRLRRYQMGISAATGERTPRELTEQMARLQNRLRDMAERNPEVVSFRANETQGLYGEWGERSFDVEFTVKPGFDPRDAVRTAVREAMGRDQIDVFISRALKKGETSANARPGVEIFFKEPRNLAQTEALRKLIEGMDDVGFTLIVDPRAKKLGGDSYIGIRFQYIPEFSARYDTEMRDRMLRYPDRVEAEVRAKAKLYYDIVAKVAGQEGVDLAKAYRYDTLVVGKENYNAYLHESLPGVGDRPAGDSPWFGQPLRDSIEGAARRYAGRESELGRYREQLEAEARKRGVADPEPWVEERVAQRDRELTREKPPAEEPILAQRDRIFFQKEKTERKQQEEKQQKAPLKEKPPAPHLMTKEEFRRWRQSDAKQKELFDPEADATHRLEVEAALKKGQRVPRKVLAEYPDIETVERRRGVKPLDVDVDATEPLAQSAGLSLFETAIFALQERTRRFHAKSYEAFLWSKQLEKLMPDEEMRKDLGAAVEKSGRSDITGDTYGQVLSRFRRGADGKIDQAKWDQFKAAHRFYMETMEKMRREVNEYLKDATEGDYIEFLSHYLPHFFDFKQVQKAMEGVSYKQLATKSPSARQRRFLSYEEAKRVLGLEPVTLDSAQLMRSWANLNWRVATNKWFIHELRNMRDADGNKVILRRNDPNAGADWVRNDNPAIRMMTAKTKGEGKGKVTFLYPEGAVIHPEIAKVVNQILTDKSHGSFIRAVETFNSWAKKLELTFSFFHHVALTESALAVLGPRGLLIENAELNPKTGRWEKGSGLIRPHNLGVKLLTSPEFVKDALMHGLVLGATPDIAISTIAKALLAGETKAKRIPGLSGLMKGVRKFNDGWDRRLWDHYHAGLKSTSYYHLVNEIVPKMKGATPAEVAKAKQGIASFINRAYGGLEWETLIGRVPEKFLGIPLPKKMQNKIVAASPKFRQFLQFFMLAPDWTLANLGIAIKTFDPSNPKGFYLNKDPIQRKLQLRYWRNMAVTLGASAVGAQAAFYMAFGDDDEGDNPFPWMNEQGRKYDIDITPVYRALSKVPGLDKFIQYEPGRRVYTHFGKQAREVMHWVHDPHLILVRKASPAVRTATEQITGAEGFGFNTPWVDKGFWESIPERAVAVAGEFVPFSFRGNQFALTAPLRRGMTPWKARVALEKALDHYAHPKWGEKRFQPKLDKLVVEILDAAERNNLPADLLLKRAVSTSRGKYYGKFFQALKDQDQGDMDKWAKAIIRLHGSLRGLQRSLKSRSEGKGLPLTEKELERAVRTYERASRSAAPGRRNQKILAELQ